MVKAEVHGSVRSPDLPITTRSLEDDSSRVTDAVLAQLMLGVAKGWEVARDYCGILTSCAFGARREMAREYAVAVGSQVERRYANNVEAMTTVFEMYRAVGELGRAERLVQRVIEGDSRTAVMTRGGAGQVAHESAATFDDDERMTPVWPGRLPFDSSRGAARPNRIP